MCPAFAHRSYRRARVSAVLALAASLAACSLSTPDTIKPGSLGSGMSLSGVTLTVGSKEFTEQLLLCHITSIALRSVGASVTEKCGLSGSDTTRTAMVSGTIDMYWEYTGTAWINYLKHVDPLKDAAKQYDSVAQQDLTQNHIKWLSAAPANSTYALVTKEETSKRLSILTLSDYARLAHLAPSQSTLCVASEFASRNDGLPGLQKAYGFIIDGTHLATLSEGAIYNAVARADPCNFGEADTTDGRILGLGLTVLRDDRQFFPIYNPALTLPEAVYQAHPGLAKIIEPIARALSTPVLQQLNREVDVEGEDPARVALVWCQSQGFVGR